MFSVESTDDPSITQVRVKKVRANDRKEVSELAKYAAKDGKLDKDPTEYTYMILYKWGFGDYVEQEITELTEEEYKQVNKELIEELEPIKKDVQEFKLGQQKIKKQIELTICFFILSLL
jgi:hypothetical protein